MLLVGLVREVGCGGVGWLEFWAILIFSRLKKLLVFVVDFDGEVKSCKLVIL